jgi:hypothetical protein
MQIAGFDQACSGITIHPGLFSYKNSPFGGLVRIGWEVKIRYSIKL